MTAFYPEMPSALFWIALLPAIPAAVLLAFAGVRFLYNESKGRSFAYIAIGLACFAFTVIFSGISLTHINERNNKAFHVWAEKNYSLNTLPGQYEDLVNETHKVPTLKVDGVPVKAIPGHGGWLLGYDKPFPQNEQ